MTDRRIVEFDMPTHGVIYGRTSDGMSRLQNLPNESVASIFKNLSSRLVGRIRHKNDDNSEELRLSDLDLSEPISRIDLTENQSQNICIIGRSALLKTSLCKLFIDKALSHQRTVYVISGGNQEYDTYQDKINLQQYHNSTMTIGQDYSLYFKNYVCKLLENIEPAENSLIVVDEIDSWTRSLGIVENFIEKAKVVKAQIICVSQNYRLEQEFLKHFPVLIVPMTSSMEYGRWAHDFFL
jgi:hypothetical protein